MLDQLAQEYSITARVDGRSERLVLWRHALRPILVPLITVCGLSLLIVTHNLTVASFLCDRLTVMRHSRIVETAGVAQLRTGSLQHPYSRELRALSAHPAASPSPEREAFP